MIDAQLVAKLIADQFPQYTEFPVVPVERSGWDNRTFHVGDALLARMPSGEHYARAVKKEQLWLPILAPDLPLPIPIPVGLGRAGFEYPWDWSVYRWLPGETVNRDNVSDFSVFAQELAGFLVALQSIDSTDGPTRKLRGGSLELYQPQFEDALTVLDERGDSKLMQAIWDLAILEPLSEAPVWYHGDIAAGNLLVQQGQLSAVIDFGGLGVGDPACDMAIAWTLFDAQSRAVFKEHLGVSDAVWNRGRGWALWKAMIVLAGIIETNAIEAASSGYALDQVIQDYRWSQTLSS